MSVSNLFKRTGLRWRPDADAVGAPDGVLLRATNMVPDAEGALELRKGSDILYSGLESSVHSLYSAKLAGNSVTTNDATYRMAGAGDTVYIDGSPQIASVGGTSGNDVAFGDDFRQMFIARGDTRKKFDGSSVYEWSIPAPTEAPTLASVAAITSTVADFNDSESPAVTATEGSAAAAPDQDGNANEAIVLTPDSTDSRGVLQRLWTTDQDFFDIQNVPGTETDLFDIYIKAEKPDDIEAIRVVYGINASSTEPYKDDRFEFTFTFDGLPVQVKDPVSEGYAAYDSAVSQALTGIEPSLLDKVQTPFEVKQTVAGIGKTPSSRSGFPPDNAWSHLTVSRGQFERVGNTSGRTWATVRGFKIVVKMKKKKSTTITFSDATWIGGGDRALTGTFRCVYQAVRELKDENGNIIYYQLSPPSPESAAVVVNHQTIQCTVSNTILNQLDTQVDQLWFYLFGGWLDGYYRFAVTPADVNPAMTIDELDTPNSSPDINLSTVEERARVPSWGFTYCQKNSSGVPEKTEITNLQFNFQTSEMDALTANVRLEPYLVVAPENIIDIAGPWRGRTWVLTNEGYLYPSSLDSSCTFNSNQVIDLTKYGRPQWLAVTGTGLYAGMELDIVTVLGDGTETPDRARANFLAQELQTAHPPFDSCHWREGNTIIYRSSDGLQELNGAQVTPVPVGGVSLQWREHERHQAAGLNVVNGRFRCTVDNGIFYLIAPRGTDTNTNQVQRYNFGRQEWSQLQFNQMTNTLSIYNEPDGTLLAGDDGGRVWKLESGTQDNGNDITVDLLWPILDGGNPLSYKDPMDFQVHTDTGGSLLTATMFKDGETVTADKTFTFSTGQDTYYRESLHDLGDFCKLQLGVSGSANEFRLNLVDLTYRVRPQAMVNLDTGYFMAPDPGDWLWLTEVEFDAICKSTSYTLRVYVNDTLKDTITVTPSTTGRNVEQITMKKGIKGERLRLEFRASDTSSADKVGFDPYFVRIRTADSGNEDQDRGYITVWPAGQAP